MIKTIPSVLLLFILLILHASTYSSEDTIFIAQTLEKSKLTATIDSLLNDTLFAPSFLGLKIVSLTDGKTIYSRNSHKLFHPASNMKLLTTSTALNLLDSFFLFPTSVSFDGEIQKGVLYGNLYIKGSGDPLFTVKDIDSIVQRIKQAGITSINGNIIGDVTSMDDVFWGEGWMWDDEPEYYEAFISPLTVNGNFVTVKVTPGKSVGDSLSIQIEPPTSFLQIMKNGITSYDTTIKDIHATRPKRNNVITVSGRMFPRDTTQEFEISVWQPEFWFLDLMRERLIFYGISVNGNISLDTVTSSTQFMTITHSLDSVLHFINKLSDNLASELLLKAVGRSKFGEPGTAKKGLDVVLEYLSSIGVDTSLLILADGSGLSFYNQVSPDALVKILEHQYKSKTFKRFLESLPTAGVDGTLTNRLKGTKAENNLRAKTGTISSVSTLSGYVTTANNELLAFSFMSNHYPKQLRDLRKLQDSIIKLLANAKLK
ncbi:MAG: D-alanyl-D-alanine carboxypeptidase/D-alanyl-D-alanine-endopeptidase [Ignavibacteriae bacterium]|nr:D-alanyl-D-alanine carboxypeptidase/D-alanyl-D-alanine-endopeptidase [Ignavibacteriota bacterium]